MFTVLFTIWFLHVAAMISPGVNMLLVTQFAASEHARSAVYATLGITLGAAIWSTCAVLGVNAVFNVLPGLRLALQIAGGLYLLHVATKLWRPGGVVIGGPQQVPAVPPWVAFRRGFLTNITNPKSALFFSSVFAAAFPSAPSHALQVSVVVMITANCVCWHLLLSWLFSRGRVRAAYARTRNTANRVASVAVGALGVGLLAATLREARR
jgi:threonine efflux protein